MGPYLLTGWEISVSEQEPAVNLLERWRAGDQAAAEELHRRYSQRLCALAEREIGQRLSRRVGADDVVQSVFRTFFRRAAGGEFVIDHSGSLWQLLVRIAINKVRRQGEYHRAGKRNVAAEVYGGDEQLCPEVIADEPGPEEAAMLADEIALALKGLKPDEAEMFQLALQGYTTPELAERFNCSRWTIRRILDRIGFCLQQQLDGPEED